MASGRQAIEVVSPILSGENGIGQVAHAVDTMVALDAKTNGSCGQHIHINLESYDVETRRNVLKLARKYELALFALNGEMAWDRYTNHFCTPIATMTTDDYYMGFPQGHGVAVNFAPSSTVEFRMFDGTFDLVDVLTRIMVCLAIVAYAHNHPEAVNNMDGEELDVMDGAAALVSILSDDGCRICDDWEWDDIKANIISRCRTADRLAR